MAADEDAAKERYDEAYRAAPLRDVPFETMSGVPVEPVYGDGAATRASTRTPGASTPTMYRSQLWTMRMFAGFGTAEDTNARFKELLRAGGTGLSTAFDMPTLMGRDSDHPWAVGEVGQAGVAVDTLADMDDLFADIDLGAVTTSMTINGPASIVMAMYIALAETSRHRPGRASAARSRTTSSRSTRRRRSTSSRRGRRCGWSPT